MYFKHFPEILKPLGKHLVFNVPNTRNEIYITFDDGPHPEITPWVIEQLAAHNAKATFFVVGQQADQYPEIVRTLVAAGHAVGNHGFAHLSGWKTADSHYFSDIDRCRQIVESKLFRPPYGQITRAQAKQLKDQYRIIMWSSLSADFDDQYSADECVKYATNEATSGSIIVFHDSEKAWPRLKHALPKCLEFYTEKGFSMAALSQA